MAYLIHSKEQHVPIDPVTIYIGPHQTHTGWFLLFVPDQWFLTVCDFGLEEISWTFLSVFAFWGGMVCGWGVTTSCDPCGVPKAIWEPRGQGQQQWLTPCACSGRGQETSPRALVGLHQGESFPVLLYSLAGSQARDYLLTASLWGMSRGCPHGYATRQLLEYFCLRS